ncbi:MAG: hypothetical protein ACRDE5_06085, partial [Ginsengibacter sp.]
QRLMGMVRAVQKGDQTAPNLKIKQMASDMSKKDVKDFASTPTKALPDRKEGVEDSGPQAFIENYRQYGQILRKSGRMQELAEKLSAIAEFAESSLMQEAGDWYDGHTIKRNMKEMKGYAGDFVKLASEADTMHQRMEALYDDMGHVLERYFEIREETELDTATPRGEFKGGNAKRDANPYPAPQVHEAYEDPEGTEPELDDEFGGIGTQESSIATAPTLEERLLNVIRKQLTPEHRVRFEALSHNNKLRVAVRAIR